MNYKNKFLIYSNVKKHVVQKRNGITEEVKFDKIIQRLKKLCNDLDEKHVDPIKIAQKVAQAIKELLLHN